VTNWLESLSDWIWLKNRVREIIDIQERLMSAQDDINAALARIEQTQATEAQAVTNLWASTASIAAQLAAGGEVVDTTGLNAAVAAQDASDAALVTAVTGVAALVTPPAPAAPVVS
jgi:hypothetical protein